MKIRSKIKQIDTFEITIEDGDRKLDLGKFTEQGRLGPVREIIDHREQTLYIWVKDDVFNVFASIFGQGDVEILIVGGAQSLLDKIKGFSDAK